MDRVYGGHMMTITLLAQLLDGESLSCNHIWLEIVISLAQ
jgi:hypothetical protein